MLLVLEGDIGCRSFVASTSYPKKGKMLNLVWFLQYFVFTTGLGFFLAVGLLEPVVQLGPVALIAL